MPNGISVFTGKQLVKLNKLLNLFEVCREIKRGS